MDNMKITSFFFSVPNRLIWENWQRFQGEQDDPDDSTDFLVPRLTGSQPIAAGSVFDYMGIPPGTDPEQVTISALPLRGMNLIYNEWFRDQNLQDSVPVKKDDTADPLTNYQLLRRGKRHDYFTSCLPAPQKSEAITIPIGGNAPVSGRIISDDNDVLLTTPSLANVNWQTAAPGMFLPGNQDPAANIQFGSTAGLQLVDGLADLTQATAVTINALRESFAIQRIFEKDMRSGTRYIEIVKSHFGVTSPDLRATRPEYLGGTTTSLNVQPVASTYASPDQPQGQLAGIGTAQGSGHGFTKSFTEHCTIIGFFSVNADITYQQGLNRMWSRQTRFDFYMPAFQALGEQPVLNKEIFISNDPNIDNDVFGFNEAYADYRYKPSLVTGKFRSSDPETLDIWHLAQNFANLPVLNEEFIVDNPPVERIVAVPTEPQFILDSYLDLKTARPMPTYAVPGMIDHF